MKEVDELMEAAQTFADLLEYPDNCKTGVPILLEVYPEDVARLKAAIIAIEKM